MGSVLAPASEGAPGEEYLVLISDCEEKSESATEEGSEDDPDTVRRETVAEDERRRQEILSQRLMRLISILQAHILKHRGTLALGKYVAAQVGGCGHHVNDLLRWLVSLTAVIQAAPTGLVQWTSLK